MAETIIERDIKEELEKNMINYTASINLFRTYPSIYDGLKFVARRLIIAADKENCHSNKPFKKVVVPVSRAMKDAHPHGDASLVAAVVKMVQPFYMNLPIFEGQGNFGSISDPSAFSSMRYIECRLSKYAEDMLENIEKNAVDYIPNYDNTDKDPLFLPVKLPNLLINGSFGLGEGWQSLILPYNINELIDLLIKILNNDYEDNDIYNLAPDLPTGGIIINSKDIYEMNKKGEGSLKVRGKVIRTENNSFVIKEIPFMRAVDDIKSKIQEAVIQKKIIGIKNIKDLTNKKNGINLEIKCSKGVNLDTIENQLYQFTDLQVTYPVNFICTEVKTYGRYSLKDLIFKWIRFRKNTIKRIMNYNLSKIQHRLHIIDGLLIALVNIDDVIKIIKKSSDKQEAQNNLIKKFDLTNIQSEFIVNMQLYKITSLSIKDLKDENKILKINREEILNILSKDRLVEKIIIEQLQIMKKKYGKKRLTKLDDINDEDKELVISNDKYLLILTNNNFIKKIKLNNFTVRKNKSMGKNLGKIKDGDYVIKLINANNKDNLLCFTNTGRAFVKKVYEIEECNLLSYGNRFDYLFKLKENEKIISIVNITDKEFNNEDGNLVMLTNNNFIKRMKISSFIGLRSTGIIATKLADNDTVKNVNYTNNKDENIALMTTFNRYIYHELEDITLMNRITRGNKAIPGLDELENVVNFLLVDNKKKENNIYIVKEDASIYKVDLGEIFPKNRVPKKISTFNNKSPIVNIIDVDEGDNLVFITKNNKIIVVESNLLIENNKVLKEIKLVNLDKNDKILKVINLNK